MRLWRLCRKPFAKKPLDGAGGLYASGRWHSAPRLVVYASESLALASLETLVHVDPDLPPDDLVALEIGVSEGISIIEVPLTDLPRSWRRYPPPPALAKLGNAWLDAGQSVMLRVPSVLIPTEFNYLINPRHPDARKFKVVAKVKFSFDPRLLGGG
jgi:RES domain-containing protein